MSVSGFRDELKTALLELAWRQWTLLGVSGQGQAQGRYILDPEALLIFTAYIGRYDQRLFDEVQDWLCVNQRFINIQRLRTLSKKAEFEHRAVLGMMAAYLTGKDASLKWKKLARDWQPDHVEEPQALFWLSNGKPMPVTGAVDPVAQNYGFKRNLWKRTGNSRVFPPQDIASLLLQLRGLFGVNARSEAMIGLLTRDASTIQDIADLSGFSWRSIQDVLVEMAHSNRVTRTKIRDGRGYYYSLTKPRQEEELLLPGHPAPWIFPDWPDFYRGCILILESVSSPQADALSPLALHSVFQEIFEKKIQSSFLDSGVSFRRDDNATDTELISLRPDTILLLPRLLSGV